MWNFPYKTGQAVWPVLRVSVIQNVIFQFLRRLNHRCRAGLRQFAGGGVAEELHAYAGNAAFRSAQHIVFPVAYPGQRVQVDVKVVPRACVADPELRLFQYTAIDEFTRLRFLAAYPEQSTYSSADFLRKLRAWYARRGIQVECVQTDNGFEFTNRFSGSKRNLPTLFEKTAAELNIRHKLIRPYTPRHNGKVERSHREDQKRFYSCRSFYSLDDFAKQLAVHNRRSNNLPMRPLRWMSPAQVTVQYV